MYYFFQTHSPLMYVDCIHKSSLNKTKSASVSKSNVPFESAMPRTWAGCSVAQSKASTNEQPKIIIEELLLLSSFLLDWYISKVWQYKGYKWRCCKFSKSCTVISHLYALPFMHVFHLSTFFLWSQLEIQ